MGYPLVLSFLFSLFGYGENLARWATILLCCMVIPISGVAAERLGGGKAGLAAALLVAVNPLAVCLNGRILTANLGYCFLSLSLSFLLLGTVGGRDIGTRFLSLRELIGSRKHLFWIVLSALFFGFTLATRDDFAMFAVPFAVVTWKATRESFDRKEQRLWIGMTRLAGTTVLPFMIGLLPNLYFNYKTYGRVLTSSHYEFGGRLSFSYFWEGALGALGLPGWAVIVLAIFIFIFPVVSLFFVRKLTRMASAVFVIILVMTLPIVVINGAYPVASSGASARYVLPLIPFISIFAGMFIVQRKSVPRMIVPSFLIVLACWHAILFYPPPVLFKAVPKTIYLAQYSPWYNRHNFMNYPHPIRETVRWVMTRTTSDAIILSDYDSYNYFFYARRDVMNKENIDAIDQQLRSRPIVFIDDHQSAIYGDSLNNWRSRLKERSITLKAIDSLPLYSPVRGEVRLGMYALTRT